MRKKEIRHYIKKSLVTALAVSVLTSSISFSAFAEEAAAPAEAMVSEEPAIVEEVVAEAAAPAEEPVITTETTYTFPSDTGEEKPYGDVPVYYPEDLEDAPLGYEPSDNVVWGEDLEDYIEEEAEESLGEKVEDTDSAYPYTVFINYLYTVDGINYSPIGSSQYADRLNGAMTSAKTNAWGFLNTVISIPDMGDGFTYSSFFVNGCEYAIQMFSFDFLFCTWPFDGDVTLDICYFLEEKAVEEPANGNYKVTINYLYTLPEAPYTYLAFAGSPYEAIYNDSLAGKTSAQMTYLLPEIYLGMFASAYAVPDLSVYGFTTYNMRVPFSADSFNEYGSSSNFNNLDLVNDIYLSHDSENVITIIYHLEAATGPTEKPTEPVVKPKEPIAEPTEPIVEPTEPNVVPPEPAEPAAPAPAPAEPAVEAAPVEYTADAAPLVEEIGVFPPMVEEAAAPAYVFPTLLTAEEELLVEIPKEELPLANIELKKTETPLGNIHLDTHNHVCNILSLLLLLAVAFVVYGYTQMAKKHDEKIYGLKLGKR